MQHITTIEGDFTPPQDARFALAAARFNGFIVQSLIEGKDVKLSGFGNFQIRTKAPRPGRNPRTGEAIPIQARRVVTFHASSKLKEQIQGSATESA